MDVVVLPILCGWLGQQYLNFAVIATALILSFVFTILHHLLCITFVNCLYCFLFSNSILLSVCFSPETQNEERLSFHRQTSCRFSFYFPCITFILHIFILFYLINAIIKKKVCFIQTFFSQLLLFHPGAEIKLLTL